MPRSSKPPKYSRHSSGQARCRIDGRVVYLGQFGSEKSHAEYGRLLQEWREQQAEAPRELTVRALAVLFLKHARGYYRHNGQPTGETENFRDALRPVVSMHGKVIAGEYGPLKLKAVRQRMIDEGLARSTVNRRIGRIRSVFSWAVSEELVPATTLVALKTVAGLQRGRTAAREPEPIRPVPIEAINAVLPHVSGQVSAMIRLQLLTGCRPDEVCSMRPADVDRSSDIWEYRPASHKNQHHGKDRLIFIGPRGQAILQPYLGRGPDQFCFAPAEAEAERRSKQRAARRTKVQPSQRDRRKSDAGRKAGARYTTESYRRAITRACEVAGVAAWSPNRLRHSRLTDLRKSHGLETSRVIGGHSSVSTTLIYAEQDNERARAAMAEVG